MAKLKYISICLVCLPMATMAQDDLLTRFFSNLEQRTLQSDFTITTAANATNPTSYTGTICMHGEQFNLQIMGMEMAYDGRTLYSYSEDNNELTLSTPTADEIAESNPLLFAKQLKADCTVNQREQADRYIVVLTPTDKQAGVSSFTLLIRKTDLMPISVEMKESISNVTTLRLNNPKFTTVGSTFSLHKPDADLNDLR